ncbi:hypothetical protein [Alloscardovia venturai]
MPDGWNHITLTDESLSRVAVQIADNIVSALPSFQEYRGHLENGLRSQLEVAYKGGTREVINFSAPTSEGGIVAFGVVQVLPKVPAEKDESDVSAIARILSELDEDEPIAPDITLIRLPHAGKAIQAISHELYGGAAQNPIKLFSFRTYVPTSQGTLLVGFETPNIDIEIEMAQLFELITSSLVIEEK